jgi:hypothetical protein
VSTEAKLREKYGNPMVDSWVEAARLKQIPPGKRLKAWLNACAKRTGTAQPTADQKRLRSETVGRATKSPETIRLVGDDLRRRYPAWGGLYDETAVALIDRWLTVDDVDALVRRGR